MIFKGLFGGSSKAPETMPNSADESRETQDPERTRDKLEKLSKELPAAEVGGETWTDEEIDDMDEQEVAELTEQLYEEGVEGLAQLTKLPKRLLEDVHDLMEQLSVDINRGNDKAASKKIEKFYKDLEKKFEKAGADNAAAKDVSESLATLLASHVSFLEQNQDKASKARILLANIAYAVPHLGPTIEFYEGLFNWRLEDGSEVGKFRHRMAHMGSALAYESVDIAATVAAAGSAGVAGGAIEAGKIAWMGVRRGPRLARLLAYGAKKIANPKVKKALDSKLAARGLMFTERGATALEASLEGGVDTLQSGYESGLDKDKALSQLIKANREFNQVLMGL